MIHWRPGRSGLWSGWAEAGTPVHAGIAVLGVLALAAATAQVASLASAAARGWAGTAAWVLAGTAACAATLAGGSRVRGSPVTGRSWLLWGAGAGCWTIGILIGAALPAGPAAPHAAAWLLVLPLICIFTYFWRVPRSYLFLLFLLDAVPVVLLILALLPLAQAPRNPAFTRTFTGLYLLMAANAIQMLGIHQGLRRWPRTWLFTLAFCALGFASLAGPPRPAQAGAVALWAGPAWTAGLLLLTAAAVSRILQPAGFVTLLPTEKQTGPHAIPPTVAVFGLIVLLVITPHPAALLRAFLLSAALVLLIRICLVYWQDVRLIAAVMGSRERLHRLVEGTSQLKSLVLEELVDALCRSARDVLGARYTAVGLAGAEGGNIRQVSSCALPHGPAAATLLRPEQPVLLTGPTRQPEAAGFPPGRPAAEGFLAVPVTARGAGRGVLYLAGKRGGFSEEDENLAELLAASFGYAVMNAELYAASRSQQEQLATQNERLRELDQLKDEFIAMVSHELRTPLTSIIGYVELLKDEDVRAPDSDWRRFAEPIDRNAHRLLRMVGDLLLLSRIQSGTMQLEFSRADLAEIAAHSVEEARSRAGEKHIELSLSAAPVPALSGDPERIAQVIDNLITNALKFTPGGGRVEVSLGPAGQGAELTVADTGIGISAPDQERIFDTFFRSETAVRQAVPGTGLGLAITKAIVDGHRGSITVGSREGGGTVFRVWLPLRPAAVPGAPGPAAGFRPDGEHELTR